MSQQKIVFMFSGQGSHYFQMGRALYDHDMAFKAEMQRMDALLRDRYRLSIIDILYKEEHRKSMAFGRTYWTNPAIVMVELALAKSLMGRGIRPDMLLGSSLGTFTAAVLAGSCSWEEALVGVIEQALTLEANCPPGTMTAVVAPPALFDDLGWSKHGEIAGISYPSHFVVSSTMAGMDIIEHEAQARQLVYQRLEVSYAFHSRWLEPAKEALLGQSKPLQLRAPSIPIMCCANAEMLPDAVPADYFWSVARKPIQFMKAFNALERTGPWQYIDVGPAGTLANFVKQNLSPQSASQHHTVMTPFGSELRNLDRLETALHTTQGV
jgi:acyl transferase domain-containing protein